jgi:hypothetical protein
MLGTEMKLVKREDMSVNGNGIEVVLPNAGVEMRTLFITVESNLLARVLVECLVGARAGVRAELL